MSLKIINNTAKTLVIGKEKLEPVNTVKVISRIVPRYVQDNLTVYDHVIALVDHLDIPPMNEIHIVEPLAMRAIESMHIPGYVSYIELDNEVKLIGTFR